MNPPAHATDSTALLPPDWSQFLPDVLVAGITGLLVGFVVLYVENRRARLREETEEQRSRLRVAEAASGTLDESFIHAYPRDSLLPDRKPLRVIRRRVNAIPPSTPRSNVVPSFIFLRAMVEEYESMRLAAERVEDLIARRVPSDEDMEFLRPYFRSFTDHSDQPWVAEKMPVHPAIEASMKDDRDLECAVRDYGRRGYLLELSRQAFNEVDRSWRAEMWPIALREIKDAPRSPLTRWWRRRRARHERADANEKAMTIGRDIMSRGGTWFGPRNW